jgi:hypothetical protein
MADIEKKSWKDFFSKKKQEQPADIDEKLDLQASEEQVATVPVEPTPIPVSFFQLFRSVISVWLSQTLTVCQVLHPL